MNRETVVTMMQQMNPFLESIVNANKITALSYFVVADSNMDHYCASVEKYARVINSTTCLENNDDYSVAGKTIDGISDSGDYQQAIIIKSMVIIAMYKDIMRNEPNNYEGCDMGNLNNVGIMTVVHEIGHAMDDANIYRMLNHVDNKILFDLNIEYDEYIEKIAYGLWGEYYAESFPYRILEPKFTTVVADGKEENLVDCIRKYSKEKQSNNIVERVYRILYFFVHCLSGLHFREQNNFDYEKYKNDEDVNPYIPFLVNVEIDMVNLAQTYPAWNKENCMKKLEQDIKDMIAFEIEY